MFLRKNIGLIFLVSISTFAQQKNNTNSFNCDSLSYLFSSDFVLEKMPAILGSPAKVQNDFQKMADKSNFEKTIYIKVIVDTLGNVHCPHLVKGTNSGNDTLAIKYIQKLKYSAAEFRRKKVICVLTIYLLGEKVKETISLIRKNGTWYDKAKE